ncbi:MAG: LysR family transcriptional regulator [Methyloligellaceae bacterium]
MHESLKKPPVGSQSFDGSEKSNALNWNDLHYFLTCFRCLSFRKAAHILNVSSSTVVRRIERLEMCLGVQLFNRLPEGVSPTSAGFLLVDAVKEMESGAIEVLRNSRNLAVEKKIQVSLSVTDWLGTYWVLPKLARFQESQPNLMVKLFCTMQLADVLRMEADIAIQFVKPRNPELIVSKLGRIHLYPFASHQYVGKYGCPEKIEDMEHHMIIDRVI